MAWYCMRARSGPSPAASRVSSFAYCCSPGTISSLTEASGFFFSKRSTSPRNPFCSPLVLAHVWKVSCPEPEPAPPPAPPPHPPRSTSPAPAPALAAKNSLRVHTRLVLGPSRMLLLLLSSPQYASSPIKRFVTITLVVFGTEVNYDGPYVWIDKESLTRVRTFSNVR